MIWDIILSAVIGVGIFFGGFFVGQNTKETVKNEYITQQTDVRSQSQTIQQLIQGQLTIIDTKTNINFNIGQITNFLRVTNMITSNTIARTNNK